LRKEILCNPRLCHDRQEADERCDGCRLTKLEEAHVFTSNGQLLSRVLRKMSAIDAGVTVTLDDILMDEMNAMIIIQGERDKFHKESDGHGQR
jgi:hypothetical protein